MGTRRSKEIERLLDEAESKRTCLVAPSEALRRSLSNWKTDQLLVVPHRGLYARGSYWESLKPNDKALHILRGLAKLHPDWVFCHLSAALAHGLYVSWSDMDRVHVAQSPKQRGSSSAHIQRHTIALPKPVTREGLSVTPVERTAIDCLRTLDFGHGLAIADSALRVTGMTSEELAAFAKDSLPSNHGGRGRRNSAQQVLDTIALANPLSENGGESLARAIMIEHGFMEPELQYEVADPLDPDHSYRVDYSWLLPSGMRVFGELDGFEKRVNPEMTSGLSVERLLANERLRESRIIALTGAIFMRFSYEDIKKPNRLVNLMESYGIPHIDKT